MIDLQFCDKHTIGRAFHPAHPPVLDSPHALRRVIADAGAAWHRRHRLFARALTFASDNSSNNRKRNVFARSAKSRAALLWRVTTTGADPVVDPYRPVTHCLQAPFPDDPSFFCWEEPTSARGFPPVQLINVHIYPYVYTCII